MSNPAMPGLIKIGMSSQDPKRFRVKELSQATGVPTAFKVEYQALVDDERDAERTLHAAFDSSRFEKEFFKDLSITSVISEARSSLDILHEEVVDITESEIREEEQVIKEQDALKKRKIIEDEDAKRKLEYLIKFDEWRDFVALHQEEEVAEARIIQDMLVQKPMRHKKVNLVKHGIEYDSLLDSLKSSRKGRKANSNYLYAGGLNQDRRAHGHGTIRFHTGVWYCGQWRNGYRHGWGWNENKDAEAGVWKNGEHVLKNKETKAGIWENGELILNINSAPRPRVPSKATTKSNRPVATRVDPSDRNLKSGTSSKILDQRNSEIVTFTCRSCRTENSIERAYAVNCGRCGTTYFTSS